MEFAGIVLGVVSAVPLLVWFGARIAFNTWQKLYPHVKFRHACEERRVVALTIDDAPSVYTADILDALREHNARATFFCIGEHVRTRPEAVDNIRMGCHETGNHMEHDVLSWRLDSDEFAAQLYRTDALLRHPGGTRRRWFRPGGGMFTADMVTMARRAGYDTALGNVYPFDAQLPFAAWCAAYILHEVNAGDVIILHDRAHCAATLRRVLPELRRRGYEVVTLSELFDH